MTIGASVLVFEAKKVAKEAALNLFVSIFDRFLCVVGWRFSDWTISDLCKEREVELIVLDSDRLDLDG